MSENPFIFATDVDVVEMLPGVHRRTLGVTDEAMLCEITLDEGSEVPLHSHPHEQVGYVVRGSIRMTIDGTARDLNPGDGYAIPGNVEHSAVALTTVTVIDCFTPPRDEYR